MKVDGINPQSIHVRECKNPHGTSQEAKEATQEPPVNGEVAGASVSVPQSNAEESNNSEDVEGIIHLLQEGHFKGVADVRLRINFHEELAAIEADELKAVAEDK